MTSCADLVNHLTELRLAHKNDEAINLLADDAHWETVQNGTVTGKAAILALWNSQDEKISMAGTKLEPIVVIDGTHVTRELQVTLLGLGVGKGKQHFESKNGKLVSMRAEKL